MPAGLQVEGGFEEDQMEENQQLKFKEKWQQNHSFCKVGVLMNWRAHEKNNHTFFVAPPIKK